MKIEITENETEAIITIPVSKELIRDLETVMGLDVPAELGTILGIEITEALRKRKGKSVLG